jgi:hypothetical protein
LSDEKKLDTPSVPSLPKVEKKLKENSSSAPSEKSSKRRVIVTDSQDVSTELPVYGIVYNPYGTSNPWFFASRSGIIIVRGESHETIAWDKISRVEIIDISPALKAKIFLLNGTIISEAELAKGTFWGEIDWGSSLLVHFSKLKVIEIRE